MKCGTKILGLQYANSILARFFTLSQDLFSFNFFRYSHLYMRVCPLDRWFVGLSIHQSVSQLECNENVIKPDKIGVLNDIKGCHSDVLDAPPTSMIIRNN